MAGLFFIPWKAFPRPHLSLFELFVLTSCLTIGTLLWYQMCFVGSEIRQGRQGLLITSVAWYLIITLVTAGILNGVFVHLDCLYRARKSRST